MVKTNWTILLIKLTKPPFFSLFRHEHVYRKQNVYTYIQRIYVYIKYMGYIYIYAINYGSIV